MYSLATKASDYNIETVVEEDLIDVEDCFDNEYCTSEQAPANGEIAIDNPLFWRNDCFHFDFAFIIIRRVHEKASKTLAQALLSILSASALNEIYYRMKLSFCSI